MSRSELLTAAELAAFGPTPARPALRTDTRAAASDIPAQASAAPQQPRGDSATRIMIPVGTLRSLFPPPADSAADPVDAVAAASPAEPQAAAAAPTVDAAPPASAVAAGASPAGVAGGQPVVVPASGMQPVVDDVAAPVVIRPAAARPQRVQDLAAAPVEPPVTVPLAAPVEVTSEMVAAPTLAQSTVPAEAPAAGAVAELPSETPTLLEPLAAGVQGEPLVLDLRGLLAVGLTASSSP